MPLCPPKPQCRTPIMDHKDYIARNSKRLEPGIQVALLISKPIAAIRRSSRIAHPNKVRRQATPERQQERDDVAPQVRRCRIAVQENNRISLSDIDAGHRRAENG